MNRILLVFALIFFIADKISAQRLEGLQRMAHPELLPYLFHPGTQTKQSASVDYSGNNDDGNYRTAFVRYKDENGEDVIFDEFGPGCIYRMQMNAWTRWLNTVTGFPQAGKARIKFYFDNERLPRINTTLDSLYTTMMKPFIEPFSFIDGLKRFAVSYYPIEFEKRLKITITPVNSWSERGNTWYQFTYLSYPENPGIKSWRGRGDSSEIVRQWSNINKDPKSFGKLNTIHKNLTIESGASEKIIIKGGGAISSIQLKLSPYTMEQYYSCFINIFWDDADTPAVHLPIGYFFGGGGEYSWPTALDLPARKLETLFFGYDGSNQSFYSYWPMPYWKNARIEIQNNSQTLIENAAIDIGYTSLIYPKDSCGYFFAKRTVDKKRSSTQPFGIAFREKGYGHVVGLTFYSDTYDMDGDEFTYLDGSRTPQIHGDGTEDDHNQGWGGSNFQQPLWGGLLNGFQGAYRIYMNDCYIFYDEISINYEFEKLAGLMAPLTDVTVFYYKKPGKGILNLTDEIDIGNSTSEKNHQYYAADFKRSRISSSYDGYSKQNAYDTLTDDGNSINGSCEFVVSINPSNDGIKIRRRLDRFSERKQFVEIFIDGVKVKERPWYTLFPLSVTAQTAWADADFEIPSSYTRGKNKIKVKFTGSQFNEFYYWVYCYN